MEIIIVLSVVLICALVSFYAGKVIAKKNLLKEALRLGEKIDKIIASNNCIDRHEWINWLHKHRK